MIETIFLLFGVIAMAVFRLAPPARAVAIVCLAGWLLLPVGNFPAGAAEAVFPYWITGTGRPFGHVAHQNVVAASSSRSRAHC